MKPHRILGIFAIVLGIASFALAAAPVEAQSPSCNVSCGDFACSRTCVEPPGDCACNPGGAASGTAYPSPGDPNICFHVDNCYNNNNWSSGSCVFQLPTCTCNPDNPVCKTTTENGACGSSVNTCDAGTLNDIPDSATEYLWQCAGNGGGTTASCSAPKPSCPITSPGTNKLTGCVYSDTALSNYNSIAPEGLLASGYADNFTALNQDWGSGGPNGMWDSYSARWQGTYSFSGGGYTFTLYSDDGSRLYIDNVLQMPDIWYDHGYVAQNYNISFSANSSHTIKVEYYERGGGAYVNLSWVNSSPLPRPDLTASGITPTSAVAGTPLIFSTTITNSGAANTGSSFSNLFQVATAPSGGGTITNLAATSMSALAIGGSRTATSTSYIFASAGQYSVRACADRAFSTDPGSITESNETNNCSAWTTVTVNPPPPVTATLSATVWSGGSRSTVWTGYGGDVSPANYFQNNLGPNIVVYTGAPYQINWSSTNAASCTLNRGSGGVAVDTSGSDNSPGTDPLAAGGGSWTKTYTLTCGSATTQLTLSVPPDPTNLNNATTPNCGPSGDSLALSWTLPSGYTHSYVRLRSDTTGAQQSSDHYNGPIPMSFTTVPGHTYTYWVHTDDYNSPGHPYSGNPVRTVTCNTGAAPTPVDGQCNPSAAESCLSGTYSNSPVDTGTDFRWTCLGVNGGEDSGICTYPKVTTCNINLTKGGYGTVTSNPAGLNCGTNCNGQVVPFTCDGSTVTLIPSPTANPSPGSTYRFVGWGGDCSGNSVCNLTMDKAKNVTAIFTITPVFIEF